AQTFVLVGAQQQRVEAFGRAQQATNDQLGFGHEELVAAAQISIAHIAVGVDARVVEVGDGDWSGHGGMVPQPMTCQSGRVWSLRIPSSSSMPRALSSRAGLSSRCG